VNRVDWRMETGEAREKAEREMPRKLFAASTLSVFKYISNTLACFPPFACSAYTHTTHSLARSPCLLFSVHSMLCIRMKA